MSLTSPQLAAWHATGYLHVPGVFTPAEVAAWHAECDRLLASELVHEDNLRTRFRSMATGQRFVEKFDPVVDVSPVFAATARDERILGVLRELFGEEARLFKDKVIFKPSGADGYAAHQDFTWWQPFPAAKLVSVMVAVDGADEANGALEVVPGRHQQHLTPGELRSLRPDEYEALGLLDWHWVATEPGDILIFHCLTPHRSGRNDSVRSRRQFYPSYLNASAGNRYQDHYAHYRAYVEAGLNDEERARLYSA